MLNENESVCLWTPHIISFGTSYFVRASKHTLAHRHLPSRSTGQRQRLDLSIWSSDQQGRPSLRKRRLERLSASKRLVMIDATGARHVRLFAFRWAEQRKNEPTLACVNAVSFGCGNDHFEYVPVLEDL